MKIYSVLLCLQMDAANQRCPVGLRGLATFGSVMIQSIPVGANAKQMNILNFVPYGTLNLNHEMYIFEQDGIFRVSYKKD